jgi:hypothetical protein
MTRLAGGIGAGVITGGGSLVGLGVALGVRARFLALHPDIYPKPMPFPVWLADAIGSRTDVLPLRIWAFGTVASLVLATVWGLGERQPRVTPPALRVLGAVFGGAAIVGTYVIFARQNLPTPFTDTDPTVLLTLVCGLSLFFAGLVALAMQKPPLELPTGPEGPGGFLLAPARRTKEHAPSYSLVATRPPLSADDVERAALALEVRVLWGGDLLSVRHLEPPRRFRVGSDASDFVVERPPDAGDLVLVEVDGARVAATVPREVTATVQASSGTTSSLDRAIAEGLAQRMDEKGGVRIPLALGARVSLTLRPRGAGASYRAEQTDADYEGQPLVFDIGLVRAGRVVGRRPSLSSLRDPVRLLASVALVACGAVALFRHAASAPSPEVDDDGVRRDDKLYLTKVLAAIDERDEAEEAEHEDDEWWQNDRHWRAWKARTTRGRHGLLTDDGWWWQRWGMQPLEPREDQPFFSLELQARQWSCEPQREAWPDPACAWRIVTPYGLRGTGAALGPDPLGRDTRDPPFPVVSHPWALGMSLDLLHRPAPRPAARVHIAPTTVFNYRHDQVLRVVRQRQAAFRDCYQPGLLNPDLAGRVSVRFVIDPEGNVSNIGNGGSDMADGTVVSCVVHAFYGLSFPPPEHGIATVTVPIDFAPR